MDLSKLPNFKRLAISKPMEDEFSSIHPSELSKLINSEYFISPYITNRPEEGVYCTIEIFKSGNDTWYKDLVGMSFFCRIIYRTFMKGKYISDFQGVKLTKNKIIIFRSFRPADVIIV